MKDLKPRFEIKISKVKPTYYKYIYIVVYTWISMEGEYIERKSKFLLMENALEYMDCRIQGLPGYLDNHIK